MQKWSLFVIVYQVDNLLCNLITDFKEYAIAWAYCSRTVFRLLIYEHLFILICNKITKLWLIFWYLMRNNVKFIQNIFAFVLSQDFLTFLYLFSLSYWRLIIFYICILTSFLLSGLRLFIFCITIVMLLFYLKMSMLLWINLLRV